MYYRHMQTKADTLIFWMPRVLSVLGIAFLSLFSLDVFDGTSNVGQMLVGFLMHNIPTFVLLVVTVLAWKRDIVGAVGFIGAGLLYIALLINNALTYGFHGYYIGWALTLSGPAFLIGTLYLVGWYKKRQVRGTVH